MCSEHFGGCRWGRGFVERQLKKRGACHEGGEKPDNASGHIRETRTKKKSRPKETGMEKTKPQSKCKASQITKAKGEMELEKRATYISPGNGRHEKQKAGRRERRSELMTV